MNITKFAHACLLVEKDGVKILLDPGTWNALPDATGVAALLITHEHQDHMDLEQVQALLLANPGMRVITHTGAGEKLAEADIAYEAIEPGMPIDVGGVSVESFGTEHAVVYGSSPCRNTGFLIGGELFVPGDALHDVPSKPVRVLALPTGGPWMKIAEAVDYAKAVKPTKAFPIHDAMYIEDYQQWLVPRVVGGNLESDGIEFIDMPAGSTKEL